MTPGDDGSRLHVGALEGRRWAGLVFANGKGGAGLGLRLRFQAPTGQIWDWEDWYWAVCSVGPHAPDGSYARVAFDLTDPPSPENTPQRRGLTLEWARSDTGLVLRATVDEEGVLEVVGDAPWGWPERWEATGNGIWRGRIGNHDLALAFGEGIRQDSGTETDIRRRLVIAANDKPAACRLAVAWERNADADALAVRARRLLAGVDRELQKADHSWATDRLRATNEWDDLVDRISDQINWMVLLQPESGSLYAPAGRRWIFPRPSGGHDREERRPDDWTAFGWDSFFNAIELGLTAPDLGWHALLAGLRTQYANGNVPNWRGRFGGTPDRSQPPVGAFATLKLHLSHPHASRIDEAYPHLLKWSDWWDGLHEGKPRRRGLSPGLYAWGSDTSLVPSSVPPWEAGASGHQRAAWESGQDDLPLWDEARWDADEETLAMSAVDLCSYRALDLECLSRLARMLGDERTDLRLREQHRTLANAMNERLWSEGTGVYVDELPGGPSPRVAASNFLPLVAGVPDEAQAHRMLAVLTDPEEFWGRWLLPSISRKDAAFADQQYWRGSIWPPMNYLVLQGLRRYGFYQEARILALRGAGMFLEDARKTGMCRENFDARSGRGHGRRFQSWGPLFALGAVEELIRASPWEGTVIGFSHLPRAPREPGSLTGVRRIELDGHIWSVEPDPAGYRLRVDGSEWIRVESPRPLTHVRVVEGHLRARCAPGSTLRRGDEAVLPDPDGHVGLRLDGP